MPPKPAGDTRHSRRENVVRERVTRIVKRIQLPEPNPLQLTKTGVFAVRCQAVAEQYGMEWHKRGHGTTSVNNFMAEKSGMYGKYMDVIELACHSFEEQWRGERKAERESRVEEQQASLSAPPVFEPEPEPELQPEPKDNGAEIDPEIMAMASIVSTLDPLTEDARSRVIVYSIKRFGIEW